jgi:hypothetical protein
MIRRAKHIKISRRTFIKGVLGVLATTSLAQPAFAATCPAETKTWTIGAFTCTGEIGEGYSDLTDPYGVALDSGDSNTHGSRVYKCDGSGNWAATWTVSAGEPGPAATCADNPTPLMKVVRTGAIDPVTLPCSPSGNCSWSCDSSRLDDSCSAGYCENSGDIIKLTRNFVCSTGITTGLPPAGCSAEDVTWVVNGDTCNATLGATAHTATAAASDSTAPTTGAANFICNDGTYTETAGSTCAGVTHDGCFATSTTWTIGTNTCVADVPSAAHNATLTVYDNEPAATGSAQMYCNNGTWTRSGESCNAPLPPVCPPIMPPPPPPELVTAACYVDTWNWDTGTAGACSNEIQCTGTNIVHFSVGTHMNDGGEYYYFGINDRYTVTWSGDCTGSGLNMSQCTRELPNGTYSATATVTDLQTGNTAAYTVTATKNTIHRNDPSQCPPPP